MTTISFVLNASPVSVDVSETRRVIDLLRDDLHLCGSKESCGTGECGACTILVDGELRLACLLLAAQVAGRSVTTIEGLPQHPLGPALQQAFVDSGAAQCGYCTPGMELAALALLATNPAPSRDEIRVALAGNLCRCTGYHKIVDAVALAASTLAGRAT